MSTVVVMNLEGNMNWSRAGVLFALGVSPFVGMIVLAQVAHVHDASMPEPVVAWLFHPNTIVISIAGLMGGMASAIMTPPKTLQGLLASIFFAVISSVMLIPAVVDTFFKEISISVLMAGSFLASMAAQRIVPLVLKRFESKLETVLEEKMETVTRKVETVTKTVESKPIVVEEKVQ